MKAYRLFLRYLRDKYGINVDNYLRRLRVPESQSDRHVPGEGRVLVNFLGLLRLDLRGS